MSWGLPRQPSYMGRALLLLCFPRAQPLAAAQDLTLKPSTYYTVPADLVARARLHWDGQDFVLFYMHRWPSSESLRMARLVITK